MTAGQVWRMPLGTSGLGAPAADSGVAPELAHRAASAMATAKRVAIDDLARFMLMPSIAGAGSTGRYRSQCQCRGTPPVSVGGGRGPHKNARVGEGGQPPGGVGGAGEPENRGGAATLVSARTLWAGTLD